MKNLSYVASDIALNILIVVNTDSIVNVYSYDNLELLNSYKLDYDYRDSKYDASTHTLYASTYNSYMRINKLWSINLLTNEIKSKSMTFGYIYGFIEVNPEKLFLKKIKVDPNGSICMIVEVNNKFDKIEPHTHLCERLVFYFLFIISYIYFCSYNELKNYIISKNVVQYKCK